MVTIHMEFEFEFGNDGTDSYLLGSLRKLIIYYYFDNYQSII